MKEKYYNFNDIDFCDPDCPFLTYDKTEQTVFGNCTKYGELNFYDWYLAKCQEHKILDKQDVV
jgi:hypothetical protein